MGFALEDQLLIQCCRVKIDPEAMTMASNLLQQDLDWDYIREASIRHGVSPLFYYGLEQLSEVVALDRLVPPRIIQELEKLYQNNGSRNRRLYRVVGDIIQAFERAGVQAMGLKDLQLAWEVYPEIGLRPMGDLDLLIRREDYEQATACMADLGFVPLPSSDIPFTLKYGLGHNFRRPSDNVWVDLQWNVLQVEWDVCYQGNFDLIDRMWCGARPMTVGDYQMLVPKPEDMLLHLCMHLEGHAYAELILFCDIVELLRHYDRQFDWQYFIGVTKRYGLESSVYYVLFLVQHLFGVPLPSSLLPELEPTYFKARIFGSLFGHLPVLHTLLDEIRLTAFPPDKVLREFETVVRQQAASAIRLYEEVSDITATFIEAGGDVVILDGTPSERTFPDPLLDPFGEIHLFILNHDLPRMRQVLSRCGFQADDAHCPELCTKELEIISSDPILGDRPIQVVLREKIERNLDHLLRSEREASNKDLALRVIGARLRGHKNADTAIGVRIKIVALSPEDMLVYLCTRLGEQEQDRLFGLISVLEFFRGYSGPLDWQQIAHKTRQHGLDRSFGEGLLMASGVLDHDQVPQAALIPLAGLIPQPRMLEWARYGPASLQLYTNFKAPFLYLLSLLTIDSTKARLGYLVRSLFGYQGNKPVLPRLMLETAKGMVSLLQKRRQHTLSDFAFWIESEAAEKRPSR